MEQKLSRILIVEDDETILFALRSALGRNGYEVSAAGSLEEAKRFIQNPTDLILLDLGLPDGEGLTLLKAFREAGGPPVIILTARDDEADIIKGLDAGADDYLVKPFSFQELEARIKALLRRSGNESVHMALRCGDLVLDPPSHRAIRNGQVIDLTVKEYRLLEYFIQNQGTALSRMNLLKNVWDKDFDTNTNVVDVYVNYLRTKIDKDFEPKLIHTVVGVGYMMEA